MRIGMRAAARTRAEELFAAIDGAESVLLAVIERECAALRAGKRLAASAIRRQLPESAELYLAAVKAAQASLVWIEEAVPEAPARLRARRERFAAILRIQLAALAMARAANANDTRTPLQSA